MSEQQIHAQNFRYSCSHSHILENIQLAQYKSSYIQRQVPLIPAMMGMVLDPQKVTLIANRHGYQGVELAEKEQKYMLTFTSAPISGSGNVGIVSDAVKISVYFTTGNNKIW